MRLGTKSVLWGVHQFLVHPISVAIAWRYLYNRWPRWDQWIAIFAHDIGYIGKPDIDGAAGKLHPYCGAWIAARIVGFIRGLPDFFDADIYWFTVLHSRDVAEHCGEPPSLLYHVDKFSIFFDPARFYIFRGRLSGELTEFKSYAVQSGDLPPRVSDEDWLEYYKAKVKARPEIKVLLQTDR